MWKKNRVSVSRKVASGRSESGQAVFVETVVIEEFPCDIVSKSQEAFHHPSGATVLTHKQLIGAPADIRNGDIVTDLDTQEQYEVAQVLSFNLLPHIEVLLIGGVVDGRKG